MPLKPRFDGPSRQSALYTTFLRHSHVDLGFVLAYAPTAALTPILLLREATLAKLKTTHPRRDPAPVHRIKSDTERSTWMPLSVIGALAIAAVALYAARHQSSPSAPVSRSARSPAPPPVAPKPIVKPQSLPIREDELRHAVAGPAGNLVIARTPQPQATSLDSLLQRDIQQMLDQIGVAYGSVVLIDPRTGQVLAMAEARQPDDPVGAIGSLTKPTVPAASVIKVVTAAALLENGVSPNDLACFHGGLHGLDASHLKQRPTDRRCETLTVALARSSNAAIARFALRDLPQGALRKAAEAFGFNRKVPSDVAYQPSSFEDTGSDLDRARAAAGFAGSSLSPLHGAWIAAVVASDGKLKRISAWDPALTLTSAADPGPVDAPTIKPNVAATLRQMMVATTEIGTGRHSFARRPHALRGMAIGGKTGSLSASEGEIYRHVSWFVGFAPAHQPKVAIAAMVINGWKWKVKAPAVARDALGLFFERAASKSAQATPLAPAAELDPRSIAL